MAAVAGQRALQSLAQAAEELSEIGAPFALIGGLAVSAQAVPRLTHDLDFALAVDGEQEAERVVNDMRDRGYAIETVLEHAPTGRLATVRLRSKSGVLVDLLFASSGIEAEVVDSAQQIDVFGAAKVKVARVPHLLALKILSRDDRRRPQDADDIRALLDVAGAAERASAAKALRLIQARGFGRRRNLLGLWKKALRDHDRHTGSLIPRARTKSPRNRRA